MIASKARRARAGTLALGAISAALATVSIARAEILIDDFSSVAPDDPWPLIVTDLIPDFAMEDGLSGVLGGSRGSTIVADSFATPGFDSVTADLDPASGAYTYTATAGAVASSSLRYDGGGDGLGADLSNELGFVIDFEVVGGSDALSIEIDLYDGNGFAFIVLPVDVGGPRSIFFDFADFQSSPGPGPFDFSNVEDMTFLFFAGGGTSFTITSIRSIPAPPVAAMMIAGLLIGPRRRR